MKSGAIAVFLITVLSGCAGVFQNQEDDSVAQEPIQIDTPEKDASSRPQADTGTTAAESETRTTESETAVAEAETGSAEPDTRAAVSAESAADTETREADPESRTTETETPAQESTAAVQSEAEATAEPAATASVDQGAAREREAPPASQAETYGAAVVSSGTNGVIIPFAHRPFADLSPHEHPPLDQEEYEQLQQVLAEKQQTEENTDRYQDEINRGRTEGGVLAWFYRLWLI